MFSIGPYIINSRLALAPMAGISDKPFRSLCRRYGAGITFSEMVTCDQRLWNSTKSAWRLNSEGEAEPRIIQIAGSDPLMMARAAQMVAHNGAHIVDINMGCPAKKVCNKAAGAALLRDEKLVGRILDAVVQNTSVPITLKIRTGWDKTHKNAVAIAKLAENSGIAALTIHGRTRACGFKEDAEYESIAEAKNCVKIPVIANGDINSPELAQYVLDYSGADAIMIGRAAQGRPWIFAQIEHYLNTGKHLPAPGLEEMSALIKEHLAELSHHYGEFSGIQIARKHVGWYLGQVSQDRQSSRDFNRLCSLTEQLAFIEKFFDANQNPALS